MTITTAIYLIAGLLSLFFVGWILYLAWKREEARKKYIYDQAIQDHYKRMEVIENKVIVGNDNLVKEANDLVSEARKITKRRQSVNSYSSQRNVFVPQTQIHTTEPELRYVPAPAAPAPSNDGLLTGLLIGQALSNQHSHHDSPGRQQARHEIEESRSRIRDSEPIAPTGYSSQETYSTPEPDRTSYDSTPSSYDSGGSSYDSGGSSYDSGGSGGYDSGGGYDSNNSGY